MAVVALCRSDMAVATLLYFLAAYAAANLAAFAVVVELRGRTERASYAGLASAQPVLALVLVVGFLSLVGMPPLAGFTAKVLLFAVTVDAGYTWSPSWPWPTRWSPSPTTCECSPPATSSPWQGPSPCSAVGPRRRR